MASGIKNEYHFILHSTHSIHFYLFYIFFSGKYNMPTTSPPHYHFLFWSLCNQYKRALIILVPGGSSSTQRPRHINIKDFILLHTPYYIHKISNLYKHGGKRGAFWGVHLPLWLPPSTTANNTSRLSFSTPPLALIETFHVLSPIEYKTRLNKRHVYYITLHKKFTL